MQRPPDGRLLVIDERGAITHRARADLSTLVRARRPRHRQRRGDAAREPGRRPSADRGAVEVRLAGRNSLLPADVTRFTAVVFGAGDFRTPTEDRPPPPALHPGDTLRLGPLRAIVITVLGASATDRDALRRQVAEIWEGLARHGRPIQYAYVPQPLTICESWTRFAGLPVAFEAPSAGFILDWAADRRAPRARRGLRHASPTRQASRQRATPSSIGCCRSTSRTTSRLQRRR